VMAAERAAELSEKTVVVVPTRSQQAGLSAAVALDPDRGAVENGAAMLDALSVVRTGAVTGAARDDAEERPARFHRGDAVGFIDERIVAWGEPAETLEAVLGELGREAELLTLIAGDGAPLEEQAVTGLVPAGVEVEYSWGGQPAYWWLIAAE
jgi:dihydroxyacetone kinase-like predicted kinase